MWGSAGFGSTGDRRRGSRAVALVAVVGAMSVLGVACTSGTEEPTSAAEGSPEESGSPLVLEVASTRADMVTGGDALLRASLPGGEAPGEPPEVSVDGESVEVAFEASGEGEVVGLLEGLAEGPSEVSVTWAGEEAALEVTNHPLQGPVIAGERLPMVTCTTDRFGMTPAEPPECVADPVVRFAWVDRDGSAQFLDGGAPEPGGLPPDAATVVVDGEEQVALLRVESRVIDRGVATFTTLVSDPGEAAGRDPGEPWDAEHWNGRLVYRFGGGCGTTYSQGFNFFDAPDLQLLADGYAFATNTLDTFQVQCQDILSAEAAMMTKEYFAENYGPPVVTIGEGGSGGAIQQLLIAQNYPGILDAIVPSLPFPDAMSIAPGVVDCALLGAYYGTGPGAALTPEQRSAINGHLSPLTCTLWEQTFVPMVDPARCGFGDAAGGVTTALPGLEGGLPTVPDELAFDAESNPDGLRCTLQDSYPQVLGRDPQTSHVRRPLDNTGVQYGLEALNDGVIDAEEFVVLNERIGGLDLDANPVPERMVADESDLEALYRTGRVVAGGGLLDIPVIAVNVYTDDEGDIHDRFRMFSLEERLAGEDGSRAPGYVMWTLPPSADGNLLDQLSGAVDVGASAVRLADEWASALAEADAGEPRQEALARTRPDAAVDTCFDAAGEVVDAGDGIYESEGPCRDDFPVGDDPRTAAGAPLANDIVKCSLQPVADAIESGLYGVDLTEEQATRLEAVFPEGVCDWTRPGVGQVALGDPWQVF